MTDLDPCLLGCDLALAEADQLLRLLAEDDRSDDPEVTVVRARIAVLRREVERLRGMTASGPRRQIHPDWINLASAGSPWCAEEAGGAAAIPIDGD